MIELKNVTPEYLQSLIGKYVTFSPKYFGNSFIADINGNKVTIIKKKSRIPVSKLDYIISDLYLYPFSILKKYAKKLDDGQYYITNNYRSNTIVIDESCCSNDCKAKYKKFKSPLMLSSNIDMQIDQTMLNLLLRCYTTSLYKKLEIHGDVVAMIVKSDTKQLFKIPNPKFKMVKHLPSDIYHLMVIDLIKYADISMCKSFIYKDWEDIYLAIIDNIFKRWINLTDNNMLLADLGYPKCMKADYKLRKDIMSKDVYNIIKKHPRLMDFYILTVMTFLKSDLPSNKYISAQLKEKHNQIATKIHRLCDLIDMSLPTYQDLVDI